jgi:hypothetical protein
MVTIKKKSSFVVNLRTKFSRENNYVRSGVILCLHHSIRMMKTQKFYKMDIWSPKLLLWLVVKKVSDLV